MKIAFTSCFHIGQDKIQSTWNQINNYNPDYLFLLGDTIYMDYGIQSLWQRFYTPKMFESIMERKYKAQFECDAFRELIEKMRKKNGLYATWDDHDFAWNNAKGASIGTQKNEITRRLFHKYMNCSTNHPHIYYTFDTPLARVIFLDVRSEADDKRLLSEEQFQFIEEKLQHSLNNTIICGGLTLTEGVENWSKYPHDLERLSALLQQKENVLYLSGDIHKNAFIPPCNTTKEAVKTPVQLISSGLSINILGFRQQHNWCSLELFGTAAPSVTFHNKNGIDFDLTENTNEYLRKNFPVLS
ncbi:alkaline phosphatase D family protein [Flammeovirga aprica]|uniref:Alkaline phosphatase family protein n=1 Tax=Flammeovirga aprica JL-4 TaxID=694437 RepID=A0A7X9RZV0_9BACT|nr:alkaline phosphatase D family protein [Flammeovirga aprica]NME71805.1 alkaline phosphatase family protein [Flammeovirga aprica JL-4]